MSEAKKLNVHKVTLSSGKVILLRELKIRHQEMAVKAASPNAGGDANLLSLLAQKELLKQLIMQINGQPVKAVQLEDLDSLFSFREYAELSFVLRSK
jgi:hypothetical protein